MISAFVSNNNSSFLMAKSLLGKENIPFIPKGENTAGLEFTSFEIFVREEDYEKAKAIIFDIEENNVHLEDKYNKKHNPFFGVLVIAGILISVVLLFVLGLWLRGGD